MNPDKIKSIISTSVQQQIWNDCLSYMFMLCYAEDNNGWKSNAVWSQLRLHNINNLGVSDYVWAWSVTLNAYNKTIIDNGSNRL